MDSMKNNNGFSLLEVLIAITVLAVGLLGVAGMQIHTIEGNDFSHDMTEAMILAQDTSETLANLGFNAPSLVDTDAGANWNGAANDFNIQTNLANVDQLDPGSPYIINNVQYNVGWYVQANTPIQNVTTVAVVVTWTAQTARQVVYRMMVADSIL
jgi:prepilin-type N-terminal cleavage/methylation domain-containing protein